MVYPPTRVPWKFHAELPGMYDLDGVSDGSELAPFPNGHTAELGRVKTGRGICRAASWDATVFHSPQLVGFALFPYWTMGFRGLLRLLRLVC